MEKRIVVIGSEHLQSVLSACLARFGPEARPMVITVQDVSDIRMMPDAVAAATDADALVLATAWPQFLSFDLVAVRKVMRGNLFFDGCNNFDPQHVERCGFRYVPVSRRPISTVPTRMVVRRAPARTMGSSLAR
jgi:hypothetical protein